MANRRANRPSIVQWERMRQIWVGRRGNATVQKYFDTFLTSHANYQFTVAQVYHGLYELGVTCEQYDAVKREIQRQTGRVLPDINCTDLLRTGDVSKRSFWNSQEFRDVCNTVKARNCTIAGEKRDEVRAHFRMAVEMFKEPGEKTIVAFDLEAYEYDNDVVLEIGFIVVRLGPRSPVMTDKCHFIIEENLQYKNRDFVADNRNGFRFGRSQTVPQKKAMEEFIRAVQSSAFLVGHAASNDETYLKAIGLDLSLLRKKILDTQMIEQHKEFEMSGLNGDRLYMKGLAKLLVSYAVSYSEGDLHNAGCDAYYTMKVFLRQMGHGSATVNSL